MGENFNNARPGWERLREPGDDDYSGDFEGFAADVASCLEDHAHFDSNGAYTFENIEWGVGDDTSYNTIVGLFGEEQTYCLVIYAYHDDGRLSIYEGSQSNDEVSTTRRLGLWRPDLRFDQAENVETFMFFAYHLISYFTGAANNVPESSGCWSRD